MGMIRKLLLSLLIIQITPTFGASSTSFIPPYEATYSTIWEKGVSFRVEGTQTLTKTNTNDWHFEFSADTLLASLSESVSFHTTNDSIRPHKYHYKSRVLSKTREAELTFNWKNMTVRNDVDSKPWTMPITQNTVDRLGLQLQVRYDLIQGKQNLKYDVADGGKIKHYRFKKGKIEHIDTKLGKLKVVKIIRTDNMTDDRQSYFWFAPEKNYLLVKMVHNEDGESYTLDLEKVSPL